MAVLLTLLASAIGAQPRRSPVDDVIEAIKRAANDLRYAEAIRLGREIESFVPQMRPAQAMSLHQILALAYFPEEVEHQQADSALKRLVAMVRLRPDAALPAELRWRGLDSLLNVARSRTFSIAAVPASEYVLGGADPTGTVEVLTTRRTRFTLAFVNRASGRVLVHDTLTIADRGRLRLRAHDRRVPFLETGEYDLRVTGVDVRSRDSVVVVRRASASASALTLQRVPALDSARLRTERRPPNRTRTVLKGLAFGVATSAVGSVARGDGGIANAFAPDPRARGVGALVLLGSIAIAATEKGEPIPEAMAANHAVRRAHERRVAPLTAENARRLALYRVTLRVAAEER